MSTADDHPVLSHLAVPGFVAVGILCHDVAYFSCPFSLSPHVCMSSFHCGEVTEVHSQGLGPGILCHSYSLPPHSGKFPRDTECYRKVRNCG